MKRTLQGHPRLWPYAAIALLTFSAAAAEIEGVVTDVHDGDSLTLTNWQRTYKIRLTDIDAPELAQPYGRDSRTSLRELCLFKEATVQTAGEDGRERTLARVTCVGVDANAAQVQRGWAWVFKRYAKRDSPLYAVEDEARRARRGLWQEDAPVPPWEWRRTQPLAKPGTSPI